MKELVGWGWEEIMERWWTSEGADTTYIAVQSQYVMNTYSCNGFHFIYS